MAGVAGALGADAQLQAVGFVLGAAEHGADGVGLPVGGAVGPISTCLCAFSSAAIARKIDNEVFLHVIQEVDVGATAIEDERHLFW